MDYQSDPMRITSPVPRGRRAGRRRLRARRHAPSHTAAWLREVAMKWTSPRRTHPFPSVTTPHGRLTFPLFAQRRRALCAREIRLTRPLSKPPEHTSSFTKNLATICAPWRKLQSAVAPTRVVLLQLWPTSAASPLPRGQAVPQGIKPR